MSQMSYAPPGDLLLTQDDAQKFAKDLALLLALLKEAAGAFQEILSPEFVKYGREFYMTKPPRNVAIEKMQAIAAKLAELLPPMEGG